MWAVPVERPETPEQARVWARTVEFMLHRIQGSRMECPGRDPDVSQAAAAALRAALAEVDTIAQAASTAMA